MGMGIDGDGVGEVPSNGSMHHVGCSSIRYSRDCDLAYVSSPRNLVMLEVFFCPNRRWKVVD